MGEPGSSVSDKVPDGLTVLVDPEQPDLDIVFVHGFTGCPRKTWVHEATGRPSKVRRINPFTESSHQEKPVNDVYWPQDLLPHTVPNARVLTYGYDTRIRHQIRSPISTNMVYDISWDFLVALEAGRPDATRRVLFIAHSLGGIVVKEMLRRSNGCQTRQPHLHGIFESTIGVVFFGTPHGGADPRGLLQHIAEALIKLVGFNVNKEVVNTLLPSSERLKELRNEFHPVAHAGRLTIHSFQEQYGVKLLNGRKVVEDTSSSVDYPSLEITEHIASNHMEMCRFSGIDDPEYKKVAAALNRVIANVPKQPPTRDCSFLSEDQRKMLLESLKFDQIDTRRMTIKAAHLKTCGWLLDEPQYCNWLDADQFAEHHGFFWIKGKPGTGKSTLIKYALANARGKKRKRTMKDRIIIEFFFNARGDNLEKSVEGMYRSLLWQLFDRVPELQTAFDSLEARSLKFKDQPKWSVEALRDLLEYSVRILRDHRITCFIDALDECDEEQIQDMVAHFERLGEIALESSTHFYVCFSSRHFPDIKVNKGYGLVLENQEGHSHDIEKYLDSELKIDPDPLAEQIREELLSKASGIFLWVVLVVQILNKVSKGGNVHKLQEKLRHIPAGLHELFKDILTRGDDNRDELLMCIQLVLFAKRPLTLEELHYAILTGIGAEPSVQQRSEYITAEVTRKFILESSKGFVEATRSESPTVQFIHESVRDFLLKENGLGELWPGNQSNFKAQSHERLKQCCAVYINDDITDDISPGCSITGAWSDEIAKLRLSASSKFPFLGYAVQHVLYHAEVAESDGISEGDFIKNFPRWPWVDLHNVFEKYAARRYTPSASLWYIFAEHNLANLLGTLISFYPEKDLIFTATKERYGPPILAALATGSQDAVCAILKSQIDRRPSDHALHDLYIRYCQDPNRRIKYGRDLNYSKSKTVLSYAVEKGDTALLALLLNMEKIDVDFKGKEGATFLSYAVRNGQEAMTRLLLERGANPELEDKRSETLLSMTVTQGHATIFKILFSRRRKVHSNARDSENCALFSQAVKGGHKKIVEFLLDKVYLDHRDDMSRTPLFWAVDYKHGEIVKLLLSRVKVDPEIRDKQGETLLSMAVRTGHPTIFKMLFSQRSKVHSDARESENYTLFSQAVKEGHKDIVEFLLDKVYLDHRDDMNQTLLFRAIEDRSEKIVELLLSTEKVDPDSRNKEGETPLLWATLRGCKTIVELLLSTGKVDPDSRDKQDRTPLWQAADNGHKEIAELLLSTGKVDPDSKDKQGQTPLSMAAYFGNKDIVELLLSTGKVNPESRDKQDRTPLWRAAYFRNKDSVELLLSTGKVDPDSKDKQGQTPLSMAAYFGNKDIVELLLSTEKVDPDSRDVNDITPLSMVANGGVLLGDDRVRKEIVELLLSTGKVDPDSLNALGKTPLTSAIEWGHEDIVRLLENESRTRKDKMEVDE